LKYPDEGAPTQIIPNHHLDLKINKSQTSDLEEVQIESMHSLEFDKK